MKEKYVESVQRKAQNPPQWVLRGKKTFEVRKYSDTANDNEERLYCNDESIPDALIKQLGESL